MCIGHVSVSDGSGRDERAICSFYLDAKIYYPLVLHGLNIGGCVILVENVEADLLNFLGNLVR